MQWPHFAFHHDPPTESKGFSLHMRYDHDVTTNIIPTSTKRLIDWFILSFHQYAKASNSLKNQSFIIRLLACACLPGRIASEEIPASRARQSYDGTQSYLTCGCYENKLWSAIKPECASDEVMVGSLWWDSYTKIKRLLFAERKSAGWHSFQHELMEILLINNGNTSKWKNKRKQDPITTLPINMRVWITFLNITLDPPSFATKIGKMMAPMTSWFRMAVRNQQHSNKNI